MNEIREIVYWQKEIFVNTIHNMGIKKGDIIVDFGCGIGNYTIPFAYSVGENGCVYAVDINENALYTLQENAKEKNLTQVHTVCSKRPDKLMFEDSTVNAVFIYDLIHSLGDIRESILTECRRVLADNGILSVLPFHMTEEQKIRLVYEIENAGFKFNAFYKKCGIHFEMQAYSGNPLDDFESYERGDIYNFRKIN